ncbi:MAG: precorrin-6y C5,15-methyltransferase (decarboxylating) subunit CbiE [Cetobacterium sp.]
MSRLTVVGLGPGNLDYCTKIGVESIKNSEIVIGGKRQLEEVKSLLKGVETFEMKKLEDMKSFVKNNLEKEITFVVSGDTGYYSLLTYLKSSFQNREFKVVPGISSFQYLFSKLEMSWEKYELSSVHGRENNFIELFKQSQSGVVLLTDERNNPIEISKAFIQNKIFDVEVIIGERLSYEDEKITSFLVQDYEQYNRKYEMNVTVLRKVK